MRIPDPANTVEQQVEILCLLRRHGSQTRRELSDRTGFSISLTRQLTQNLVENGYVTEDGMTLADARGRPALRWSLAADACLAIGLGVGGEYTRVVVLDARGEIIVKNIVPTVRPSSSETLLHELGALVTSTLDSLGSRQAAVRRLGVAFSGFVDYQQGESIDSTSISYAQHLPLQRYLEKLLNLPVIVEDDSRAMTLAETRYGAAQETDRILGINVGVGIGMGIIIGGELYRGEMGLAGELGHIQILPLGPRCRCGGQGCLEMLASGSAIIAHARRMLEQPVQSYLYDLSDPSQVTVESVTQAALKGDKLAMNLLEDAGVWLGIGIAIAVNLFSPRLVVLTGDVMRENEILYSIVQREAHRHILSALADPFPIVMTTLDEYAGALGAATLALDAEFDGGFATRLMSTPVAQSLL